MGAVCHREASRWMDGYFAHLLQAKDFDQDLSSSVSGFQEKVGKTAYHTHALTMIDMGRYLMRASFLNAQQVFKAVRFQVIPQLDENDIIR